jgi:hypothetical protein
MDTHWAARRVTLEVTEVRRAISRSATSRRSVPIRRSTYAFYQGDLGEIGRSRIPIVRSRRVTACPYARSLSRIK